MLIIPQLVDRLFSLNQVRVTPVNMCVVTGVRAKNLQWHIIFPGTVERIRMGDYGCYLIPCDIFKTNTFFLYKTSMSGRLVTILTRYCVLTQYIPGRDMVEA